MCVVGPLLPGTETINSVILCVVRDVAMATGQGIATRNIHKQSHIGVFLLHF